MVYRCRVKMVFILILIFLSDIFPIKYGAVEYLVYTNCLNIKVTKNDKRM